MTIVSSEHQLIETDNRRHIIERHTDQNGRVHERRVRTTDPAYDILAERAAYAAALPAKLREKQFANAIQMMWEGVDLDDAFDAGEFSELTRNDVRRKCLRRLANRMEGIEGPLDLPENRQQHLANANAWVQSLTVNTVKDRLSKNGGVQWSNPEVNALRSDLAAIAASVMHGKGVIDEDND